MKTPAKSYGSTATWALAALLLMATSAIAQISIWQLGGSSGLEWSEHDTSQVFIDFAATPTTLQPHYFTPEQNILPLLDNWSPFRFPTQIGYTDGETPRIWKEANGFFAFTFGSVPTRWVDGDSTTYNPPVAQGVETEWYTIDVGVPVPAQQFGFFTPPRGLSADGSLLRDDIVEAFEVSVSEETPLVLNSENSAADYNRLETLVADVPANFEADVRIDFPRQYVRFVRFKQKPTINTRITSGGQESTFVLNGTIGDFELRGEGAPKRATYTTRIIDLGRQVNFGRLSWSATTLRKIDETLVEVTDARAFVEVEVRSGRDADPNIYQEFLDTGEESEVTRQRYEEDLREPVRDFSGTIQEGKPGLRASILYDSDDWTFWSFPIIESGAPAPLQRGQFLQIRATLQSRSFTDIVRLDSLWIEVSTPLARQVVGEVARIDQPRPERGFTQVDVGATTDFTCDLRAEFDDGEQEGFDAVRIRTGSRSLFRYLKMGEPLTEVEALSVEETAEGLLIQLPQKITAADNKPLRLVFSTQVFVLANTFEVEVLAKASGNLPQKVEAGDASQEVETNSLQVWGNSAQAPPVIGQLHLSTSIFTPNGDGTNDRLSISYTLFRLPLAVPVELEAYALNGRRVARLELAPQRAGPQQIFWDGRDDSGHLLPPGVYLLRIAARAESATFEHLRPVGIAY